MTAEERSAKFSADIDAIERMTPDQLRTELRRMAASEKAPSVIHAAAVAALATDMVRLGQRHPERYFDGRPRLWCGHRCPFTGGCVTCDLA